MGMSAMADEVAREHGSRIIAALERAWAAIRDRHPEVPDVVIVTGAGNNQKGLPEGYRLRGHHWPERWVTDRADRHRMPELFVAGELLAAGGRAVLEVMLHEAAHALAVIREIRDTSAEGNRYHNKRFVSVAQETRAARPGPARESGRLVRLPDHRRDGGRLRRRYQRDQQRPAPVPARWHPGRPRRRRRGRGPGRRRRRGRGQAEEARRPPGRRRVRLPAAAQAAHDPQADRGRPGHLRTMPRAFRGTRGRRRRGDAIINFNRPSALGGVPRCSSRPEVKDDETRL